jgi:hypothetical protein
MKLKLPLLVGLASLAALIGVQAQSAVTDPVGYITHTINPAIGSKADTLIAPALVNKNDFVGTSSAPAAGSAVINFSGSVPVGLGTASYLEITTGPQEGWWASILSSTATSITLDTNVPASATGNLSVAIRKHMTLDGFLGSTNAAGLDSGTTLDDADEVQTLNPVTGSVTGYFYASLADVGGDPLLVGWYTGSGSPAGAVVIEPGVALQVRHKLATTLSLVSVGYVKKTKTQVDLVTGDNWVTPMRATGVTLANSGLDTGIITTGVDQGSSLDDADELQFLNPNQSITSYFAAEFAAVGVNGWFTGAGGDANAINIAEPVGVIVRRKVSSPATWTVPAVTIN